MSSQKKIVLQIAMEAEAEPILAALRLKEDKSLDPCLGITTHTGSFSSLSITLLSHGREKKYGIDQIGLEFASLVTYLSCSQLQPDLIINAGTAGGDSSKGADIGKVYLAGPHCVFHDHRIPIPGFHEFGLGTLPCFAPQQLLSNLNLPTAVLSSGSSLDFPESDKTVFEEQGATLKDMEGAAIARIAERFNTPAMFIKSVTDLIDHPEKAQDAFLRNLAKASANLKVEVLKVLEWLDTNY